MNRAVLMGRLTKDPVLNCTPSGVNVCSFTVACDRRYQTGGERQADFISCVAWREKAEFLCKYFKKGMRIALEGSIQVRSWNDQSGNKRYSTEVVVDHVEFAEALSANRAEGTSAIPQTAGVMQGAAPAEGFDYLDEYDDLPIDLPF